MSDSSSPRPAADGAPPALPPAPTPSAPPSAPALEGNVQMVGNLLVFGAAACYAVYEVWFSALMERNQLPTTSEMVNTLNVRRGISNPRVRACPHR